MCCTRSSALGSWLPHSRLLEHVFSQDLLGGSFYHAGVINQQNAGVRVCVCVRA